MSGVETVFKPNLERLKKLQAQSDAVRIGGKGVPRRKKKVVHKTASTDDKKLQVALKKLAVNVIQGIEEVNMFRDNGEVLHFSNPKVQASLQSNVFAISGHSENKRKLTWVFYLFFWYVGFGFRCFANLLQISNKIIICIKKFCYGYGFAYQF